MLHIETVEPGTFSILERLMLLEALDDFALVGGTAHPLIGKIESTGKIRMYADTDIIAMKFNAILGRSRKKDFWDVYELMHHYHLKDMIRFHETKFPDQNLLITIPQALTYFDDAEESEDPISLKGQTWESVKKFIQQKVSDFLR